MTFQSQAACTHHAPRDVPRLPQFINWLQADDAHAAHHLRLLGEADDVLTNRTELPPADRLALADRLERWRYQWLAEHAGRMTDKDRELVDALDLAAAHLAARPTREPRNPRAAIHHIPSHVIPSRDREGAVAAYNAQLPSVAIASLAWPCSELHERHAYDALLDATTPLDELIHRAQELTNAHFGLPATNGIPPTGRRMLLYAPLYLSSFCINECRYCGFRFDQSIDRRHLSVDQAVAEAEILRSRGFHHILLVAGDFPRLARTDYFAEIIARLRQMDIEPAVEIAPQSTRSYADMVAAGLAGVTLYQETYDEACYRRCHPGGTKAAYDWRLEGLERAAESGVKRLGLGVLLGLADPREDVLAMIRHGLYLRERFPEGRLAFSLPRIHEAPGDFRPPFAVDDGLFVRLYCILRLTFPDANLVLSTRETPELRDRLWPVCITQLSAGSRTAPGAYGHEETDGQFPVHDQRTVEEVTARLKTTGFHPVWTLADLWTQ